MSVILALLIVAAALGLIWWFVSSLFPPRQPADPVDDPFSPVPVPRKRGPGGRAGAVALEEPEDGDDLTDDAFPPRGL
jgi:hypothetical protein